MTRSVAFYLPQYHRIPENDAWWGEGFTEWTNVRRAVPRYKAHYQPHVPGELGYYDLTDANTRHAQAALALEHGVDAFCYYHYWFSGRRLLDKPFDDVLRSGEPRLPFMLCWANEPWTRSWSGGAQQVLMPQQYSSVDDLAHIRAVLRAFADPRYVRVHGRPVFLVYKVSRLPDPRRTADLWREEAVRVGVGDPYLVRVESDGRETGDPAAIGFDAAVDFQPDWRSLRPPLVEVAARRAAHRLRLLTSPYRRHIRCDYDAFVEAALARPAPTYTRFPSVVPSWDNSARRQHGAVIIEGATPERYERWVRAALATKPDLLFVNAWNEWGEGCHLEPDQRWGRGYLEAHLRATRTAVPAR